MSTREDRSQASVSQPNQMEAWTIRTLARELVLILSASAGIIAVLMALKGLQSVF